MNPFNWNGPEFLAFYLILAVAAISAQVWMRRTREAEAYSNNRTPQLTDPYLVAYLAGGVNGMLRCVTVALLERNLLRVTGDRKELLANREAVQNVQAPIEAMVLNFFDHGHLAREVFNGLSREPAVTLVGDGYRASLEEAGLLPNAEQRKMNTRNALSVMLMLAAVAVVRLYLAEARGHRNVGFLCVLSITACIASLVFAQRRPTHFGRVALADLKQLFGGLQARAHGGFESVSPADVAFLSALFGVAALGGARQLYAKELFPASASSSGCGSSCGSSGGGDGGGGCGGGGCGGCGG